MTDLRRLTASPVGGAAPGAARLPRDISGKKKEHEVFCD